MEPLQHYSPQCTGRIYTKVSTTNVTVMRMMIVHVSYAARRLGGVGAWVVVAAEGDRRAGGCGGTIAPLFSAPGTKHPTGYHVASSSSLLTKCGQLCSGTLQQCACLLSIETREIWRKMQRGWTISRQLVLCN